MAQRLYDVAGIKEELAYWAVESWALALGVIQQPVPKQNVPHQQKITTTPPTIKPIELQTYKLGDILPGGGIVFHVDISGQHGLTAQPKDETKEATWDKAQRLASAHGQGWHLPTQHELALLYKQKNVVGGFANDCYWSSTGHDSNDAWYQSFFNGYTNCLSKGSTLPVRAVRAF